MNQHAEQTAESPAATPLGATEVFLLRTLADYLNQRYTAFPEDLAGVSWDQIITLARNHQVSAIVYHQCKGFIPEHAECAPLEELSFDYVACPFSCMYRQTLLEQIDAELTRQNIPYILFKGTEIAQHYPIPEFRTMVDSDILVHEEDKLRAHEVLMGVGLQIDSQGDNEWNYFSNGLGFELHHRLLYDYITNYEYLKDYCDTAWNHASPVQAPSAKHELDWNFHVAFLLLHLRKHMLHSGVGIRQYMDLAVMARCEKVDWDKVAEVLEALKLLEFAHACMAFCERWFNVKSPWQAEDANADTDADAADEAFFQSAAVIIMKNGVFGFDNEENRNNHTMNEIRTRTGKSAKMRVAIRRVFPEYEIMSEASHYKFLKGRPWLLPAAWVYRFGYSLTHRKVSHGLEIVKKPLELDDTLHKRDAILRQWGL